LITPFSGIASGDATRGLSSKCGQGGTASGAFLGCRSRRKKAGKEKELIRGKEKGKGRNSEAKKDFSAMHPAYCFESIVAIFGPENCLKEKLTRSLTFVMIDNCG
jgi:hypothetical protein